MDKKTQQTRAFFVGANSRQCVCLCVCLCVSHYTHCLYNKQSFLTIKETVFVCTFGLGNVNTYCFNVLRNGDLEAKLLGDRSDK
jgi:hypothetical protein